MLLQRADYRCILRNVDEIPVQWGDMHELTRRIRMRVQRYRGYMLLHELAPSKKTLVVDVDYTMLDTEVFNNNSSLTPSHWRRPHLHAMLEAVAPYYNIVVWSATGSGHVLRKLSAARLLQGARFQVALLVDYGAMVRVRVTSSSHRRAQEFNTKPLAVLWALWPSYMTPENTLMIDDHRRSFLANPRNGILVRGFRSHERHSDREFDDLTRYLLAIRNVPSVCALRHDLWREVATGAVTLADATRASAAESS